MLAGKDVIAKAPHRHRQDHGLRHPHHRAHRPGERGGAGGDLAPTRELAMQITEEMRQVAVCHEGYAWCACTAGQPIGKQINALKRRPQIVVATPGACPTT